jgi:hypothetical protein
MIIPRRERSTGRPAIFQTVASIEIETIPMEGLFERKSVGPLHLNL